MLGRVADVTEPGHERSRGSSRPPTWRPPTAWPGGSCAPATSWRSQAWGDGDTQPLREVRDLAARTGALVTQAVMDLSLADLALGRVRPRGVPGRRHRRASEASRRYGLATEPVAHLWLAGGHALAGDDAAMEASLADALARDPDDPRILGDLHGRVLVDPRVRRRRPRVAPVPPRRR